MSEPGENATNPMKLSASKILGSFGALMAIVGVFVTIDPRTTPLFIDLLVVLSCSTAVLTVVVYAGHASTLFGDSWLQRLVDLFERDTFSHLALLLGSTVFIIVVFVWERPTPQQILDERGFRFESKYYQTALEVGNSNAIAFFHQAGFDPDIAYIHLGGPGVTNNNKTAIDILLEHDYRKLRRVFELIGRPPKEVHLGLFDRIGSLVPEDRATDLETSYRFLP